MRILARCMVFVIGSICCLGIFSVDAKPAQQAIINYLYASIALSGNGQIIAIDGKTVADPNNADGWAYPIDFYDTQTGKFIHSLQTIWPNPPGSISLNADGSALAYSTVSGEVGIVDAMTGKPIGSLADSAAEIGYTRWNSNSDLVAAFTGGVVIVHNGSTGKQDRLLFDAEANGVVNGIAWNSNGRKLASTTYSSAEIGSGIAHIQVWDMTETASLEQVPVLRFEGGGSFSLDWSPDDKQIASNTRGGILVYDAETGESLPRFSTGNNTPIYDVAWSPDGTKIAGGAPQAIWIWNVATHEIIETFSLEYIGNSLVWSPDSLHLYHSGGPEGIYRDGEPLSNVVVSATPKTS